MTAEEKDIAILEWMGWSQIGTKNSMAPYPAYWKGYPPNKQIVGQKEAIPYLRNDLEAIRIAELMLLNEGQNVWHDYVENLCEQCSDWESAIVASANQRTEAVFNTIQKLKEQPLCQIQNHP